MLDDASMATVVTGPGNRSRGLIGCCVQKSGIYDHKRHHAKKKLGIAIAEMWFVWDFVLVRDDGSRVALHPNYSNTFVDCRFAQQCRGDIGVPRDGLGGSNGPGTFRKFSQKQVDCKLRFDASKRQPQSRASQPLLVVVHGCVG